MVKAVAPCASEHEEAKAFMQLVELHTPFMPDLASLYAIPNGGARNVIVAAKMKAEGVKRGVPDYCLAVSRDNYHGLYIELKRKRDGELSKDQRDWIERLQANGYRAVVAKGATEAWATVLEYMRGKR